MRHYSIFYFLELLSTFSSSHHIINPINETTSDVLLVKNYIKEPKGTIVDVGGNMGVWMLKCKQFTNNNFMAYEPEPTLYKTYCKNIEENNISNIDSKMIAIGDQEGSLHFRTSINGWTVLNDYDKNHKDVIEIKQNTLDNELKDVNDVSFIKIDVEGHESYVLDGAIDIIKKHKPNLMVEIHPQQLIDRGRSASYVYNQLSSNYSNIDLFIDKKAYKSKIQRVLNRYSRSLQFEKITPFQLKDFSNNVNAPTQIYSICY